MSSHHIVRDCQEPALWITASNTCSFELIQELLGWSPWLLVEAGVAQQVIQWGLKFDAFIVLSEEVEHYSNMISDQTPLQVIDYQEDSIDAGLKHLLTKKISTIHLCTSLAAAKPIQAHFPDFEWIFFYRNYKMIYQGQGSWKKWVAAGQELIIEGQQIEVSNLIQSPKNTHHYQAIQEGFVEIKCEDTAGFWISEKLD